MNEFVVTYGILLKTYYLKLQTDTPPLKLSNHIHLPSSYKIDFKLDNYLEIIAIISGLASVWLSRRESVLTYPVGLINTSFYTYLSFKYHLPGESAVNFYYTVMSAYGWYMWALRNDRHEKVLHITFSDRKMWQFQLLFFIVIYIIVFSAIILLKDIFWEGAIPAADAFATATAFTGMWLMTRKKVESWYWWIATNIASIPLYYVKGLELTSGYYAILLVFAFWGLATWKKKGRENRAAGS